MGQLELLLITAVISIIPGQLVRIPLFGQEGSFTVSDIFALILAVSFLFYFFFEKVAIVMPKKIMLPTAVFSLFAVSSTVFALNRFSPKDIFVCRHDSYFFRFFTITVYSESYIFGFLRLGSPPGENCFNFP